MKKLLVFNLMLLLIGLCSCQYIFDRHLIDSKQSREEIHKRFQDRINLIENYDSTIKHTLSLNLSTKEREGLEFLYAYMPLNDLSRHNSTYVLKQVQTALEARSQFKWAHKTPSNIYLHFVLPFRVNNEYCDTARQQFYQELRSRINGMNEYDAALEVNYWCHEKVTYKPTNSRTCGPLTTVKSTFGRCGEESTFAVAAYRSVGIPARQVYTPRWAHTDDNHAWVEVYVDGKWHFLGACEPEPELDRGWFAGPAKRAMMTRTFVYGKYEGPEEILKQTDWYTEINLLPNYAPTKKLNVKVVDSDGKPVQNAKVEFQLYNYAEFYPIATKQTDKDGNCSVTTGFGDLMVWAEHNEETGWVKANKNATDISISISNTGNYDNTDLTLTPPVEQPVPSLDAEKGKQNAKRIKEGDEIRNKYIATFIDSASAANLAMEKGTSISNTWKYLSLSKGNWEAIYTFIKGLESKDITVGMAMLNTLNEKDLRDISAKTLMNHLSSVDSFPALLDNKQFSLFDKYILSPGIGLELITPWRGLIQSLFTFDEIGYFRNDPINIIKWINKNITIDNESNYYHVPICPDNAIKFKIVDPASRDILFVAMCRSFGIPARLNPATKKPEYLMKETWFSANFENISTQQIPQGTLKINLAPNQPVLQPLYYSHFTIAKLENGQYRTLDYEESPIMKHFPIKVDLDEGKYRLITGNRESNGEVLVRVMYFDIKAEDITPITLSFLEKASDVQDLGNLDNIIFPDQMGNYNAKLEDATNNGDVIIAIVTPQNEPSIHILNDLAKIKSNIENWNGFLYIVTDNSYQNAPEELGEYYKKFALPSNTRFCFDKKGTFVQDVINGCRLEAKTTPPIVIVVKQNGEILMSSTGYKVGLDSQIAKALSI